MAHLIVMFKESQFLASKRNVLYGKTEFLANIGGLLGLFLGFSIMSILELVYFITIRVCCTIRRQLHER
jgi:acid-sensing ion channel, other